MHVAYLTEVCVRPEIVLHGMLYDIVCGVVCQGMWNEWRGMAWYVAWHNMVCGMIWHVVWNCMWNYMVYGIARHAV